MVEESKSFLFLLFLQTEFTYRLLSSNPCYERRIYVVSSDRVYEIHILESGVSLDV